MREFVMLVRQAVLAQRTWDCLSFDMGERNALVVVNGDSPGKEHGAAMLLVSKAGRAMFFQTGSSEQFRSIMLETLADTVANVNAIATQLLQAQARVRPPGTANEVTFTDAVAEHIQKDGQ